MNAALQQDILSAISEFLTPHLRSFHQYMIVPAADGIEVRVQVTEQEISRTLMLKVLISDRYPQVEIPNIFMPPSIRQQGIGKALLAIVQSIAKKHGYRTFVSELTTGFFERLKNRGALVVSDGDVVEIVDETRLT